MLILSIIIYTLFGCMFLWFIISGVQKIKSIRAEQESAAALNSDETHVNEETTEETQDNNDEINS